MSLNRRAAAAFLLIALSAAVLPADPARYRLGADPDAFLLVGGGGLLLGGWLLPDPATTPLWSEPAGLDSALRAGYSPALDTASDLLLGACAAGAVVPLALALSAPDRPREAALAYVTMLAETLLLAQGVKRALNVAFPRVRPYVNDPAAPEALRAGPERWRSFPSGHATNAFALAACSTTLFAATEAPVWLKVLFGAASGSAAAGVAALRVASGNHYPSDVLAGAAIGAACGWLVPRLHRSVGPRPQLPAGGWDPGATPGLIPVFSLAIPF